MRQLDNKVFGIIDARCNHEEYQPYVTVILVEGISLRVEQIFLYALNICNAKQAKLFVNKNILVTKRNLRTQKHALVKT